ncbi:MAG TPA: ribosome assembly RNA-binding protein YhbY [Bacillota bacterium]|nr:ribosome assembly RNA-binding protein YhbY [Bacillota bacterium]HOL09230.1 ribosome assembly RNA-binding protein YhbY [Bacillota bacterium]HPO97054.1 ribosome assembly RNA-binding protein YhbY [Bacillota bacterium]
MLNKQRNFLRALGNEMQPIVIVGKSGINENLLEQLDQALTARELVKCRVLPHTPFDTREIAEELALKTNSEIVQVVGRNMLLYRKPTGKESKLPWPTED